MRKPLHQNSIVWTNVSHCFSLWRRSTFFLLSDLSYFLLHHVVSERMCQNVIIPSGNRSIIKYFPVSIVLACCFQLSRYFPDVSFITRFPSRGNYDLFVSVSFFAFIINSRICCIIPAGIGSLWQWFQSCLSTSHPVLFYIFLYVLYVLYVFYVLVCSVCSSMFSIF